MFVYKHRANGRLSKTKKTIGLLVFVSTSLSEPVLKILHGIKNDLFSSKQFRFRQRYDHIVSSIFTILKKKSLFFISKVFLRQVHVTLLFFSFLSFSFYLFPFTFTHTPIVSAAGPTPINQNITEPTTFTRDNSPYTINFNLTVQNTLTIEPGVVVKFSSNGSSGLFIDGANGAKIIAHGTEHEPIVFTSYSDTEYDNVVSTNSPPQPGDWARLWFQSDTSELSYVISRYAQDGMRFSHSSAAQVVKSTVEYNSNHGVVVTDGAAPVLDNILLQHHAYGGAMAIANTAGAGVIENSLFQHNTYSNGLVFLSVENKFLFENNTHKNNITNAAYFHDAVIDTPTVWRNIGLSYTMHRDSLVLVRDSLTIEQGVVLKFVRGANIPDIIVDGVNGGSLNIYGSPDNPVIFTSYHDDEFYPIDTLDRGAQTGDWYGIRFTGDTSGSVIEHAVFNYGSIALDMRDSNPVISHIEVTQSFDRGLFVVSTSDTSPIHPQIHKNTIQHNHEGLVYSGTAQLDATDNYWGDDSGPRHPANPNGQGDIVVGNVLFDPWKTSKRDPVILVPGILGSWQSPFTNEWLVDPILHTYDNLWSALQNAGYEVDTTLFAFPYEWRQDNGLTAIELKQKIDEVKGVCECSKVDLVAHSMGGLVARSYIQGVDYGDDVDQLIFLGVPHRGSPESYLKWEAFEGFNNIQNLFIKPIFRIEALKNGYLNVVNYLHEQVQSLGQLLPIDNYLKEVVTNFLREYPNNYPRNTFLENLNIPQAVGLLTDRADVTNLAGNLGTDTTLTAIRVVNDPDPNDNKWMHGYPENFDNTSTDQGLENGPGDTTVPLASQDIFDVGVKTITVPVRHADFATGAQQEVIKALTGNYPSEFVNETLIEKLLLINIKSPADFYVIAPDGKRIGKNMLDGGLYNEISLGFYTGFAADVEFVTIPNPTSGVYQVVIEGTGTGVYTLEAHNITDTESSTQEFTGYTEPGVVSLFNIEYTNDTNALSVITPEDTTAPDITVYSPQDGSIYTRHENITVEYEVSDNTGVQQTAAILSGNYQAVENGEVIDLFPEPLGVHSLTITATDFLGNISTTTVEFETIATYSSFIQSIHKAYSRGWVKQYGIYRTLLAQAQKLEHTRYRLARQITLRTLLKEMSVFYSNHLITEKAYNLFTEDINYLLSVF